MWKPACDSDLILSIPFAGDDNLKAEEPKTAEAEVFAFIWFSKCHLLLVFEDYECLSSFCYCCNFKISVFFAALMNDESNWLLYWVFLKRGLHATMAYILSLEGQLFRTSEATRWIEFLFRTYLLPMSIIDYRLFCLHVFSSYKLLIMQKYLSFTFSSCSAVNSVHEQIS